MRRGEIFVPLETTFPDNPKVRALSRFGRDARPARDLYVQMLLYCKRTKSDGHVPDEQLGLLAYPDPVKFARRDAEHLAEVGLIERTGRGWLLPGWLERNPSRASIDAKSAAKSRAGRYANHERWHSGSPVPDCEWCRADPETDPGPDQSTDPNAVGAPIQSGSQVGSVHGSKETETETETETEVKDQDLLASDAGRQPEPGSDDDPQFAAFWAAYPRKTAKVHARKAWRTAVRTRKADPAVIIAGAERYRDDPRRNADPTYVAHPATWLNGDRWHDYDEKPQVTAGSGQVPWWEA